MGIYIFLAYIILLFVSVFAEHSLNSKNKNSYLIVLCFFVALIPGLRSIAWSDTIAYVTSFMNEARPIFDIKLNEHSKIYNELGFYWLGFIVKTFTNDSTIYLLFVSAITIFFLYKDLRKYSIFPILGLFVYVARFYFGRNFMQIRAGLSYLIIILSTKYIQERKFWKFLLVIFIAYQFHHSAVIAIPVYFLCNWMTLKKWHICVGLAVAFIIGAFFQGPIHALVVDNASDLNISSDYIEGGAKGYVEGRGLGNPMIYFQTLILLAYTFLDKRLVNIDPYYYVIRAGYFYSTVILIVFCTYAVLSGRTSTIFATYEIAIIPSMVMLFNKKNKMLAYMVLVVVLSAIFYMYIQNTPLRF